MKSSLIFRPKHLRILLSLRDGTQNWSIAALAKASESTYVHACNFLAECEKQGITRSERHGPTKEIALTEKGTRIANLLSEASQALSGAEAPKENQAAARQEPPQA